MLKEIRVKKEPTQERARATVEAIVESVADLLDKGDPAALTTTRIAERAGVSVGSLYQYFPSREAIYSRLIEYYFRRELEFIRESLQIDPSEGTLDEVVGRLLERICSLRKRSLRYERGLMKVFSRAGDFDLLSSIDEKMFQQIDELLVRAAALGRVRRTESTAFLLMHMIRTTFIAVTAQRPDFYDRPEVFLAPLRKAVVAVLEPGG